MSNRQTNSGVRQLVGLSQHHALVWIVSLGLTGVLAGGCTTPLQVQPPQSTPIPILPRNEDVTARPSKGGEADAKLPPHTAPIPTLSDPTRSPEGGTAPTIPILGQWEFSAPCASGSYVLHNNMEVEALFGTAPFQIARGEVALLACGALAPISTVYQLETRVLAVLDTPNELAACPGIEPTFVIVPARAILIKDPGKQIVFALRKHPIASCPEGELLLVSCINKTRNNRGLRLAVKRGETVQCTAQPKPGPLAGLVESASWQLSNDTTNTQRVSVGNTFSFTATSDSYTLRVKPVIPTSDASFAHFIHEVVATFTGAKPDAN